MGKKWLDCRIWIRPCLGNFTIVIVAIAHGFLPFGVLHYNIFLRLKMQLDCTYKYCILLFFCFT